MRTVVKHWRFWLFAAVSGALTVWIALQVLGVDPRQGRYDLTASFEDATSLRSGDPVRLSGIEIGQVSGIRVEMGMALVDFEVNDDVDLPVDTEVAVRSQNLIGMRELVLTPGTAEAMLQSGDHVEVTSNAIELGALVNELGPLLEAVDPERLNELNDVLNSTLSGNREPIADITSNLSVVLDQLASRRDTIAQLIDDYGTITAEVARRDGQIQQLIDNIVLLSETFSASEDVLVRALDESPSVADQLSALLQANAGNLDATLADLSLVTGTLTDNLDLVDRLLEITPGSLRGVLDVTSYGQFLNLNMLCLSVTEPPCLHPLTNDGQARQPTIAEILEEVLGFLTDDA